MKAKILPTAEQAVTHYKKALEKDKNFIESRFHVSLMYQKIYKFAEALKELDKVIEERGDDKTVYNQRGRVFQDMGNHDKAVEDFSKAIELEATHALSWYYRGKSKLQQAKLLPSSKKHEKLDEAFEDFRKSRELDADGSNAGIDDGIGSSFHLQGDHTQAIENFTTAISKEPENLEFLQNRADCYIDLEDYQSAIEDLRTGL